MAQYKVKEDCMGVRDRRLYGGDIFEAESGLKGSWFEEVSEAQAEVLAEPEPEAPAEAEETVAEDGITEVL